MAHNVQAPVEYIMKTEQLSGASSDNRARTKWWIFPSEVEKAGGVQSRRMAMGWSALCPLVPPSIPPSTTNLSSLSSSSHPDPLRQPIYSTSCATIHWICNCTVSALDLCGTRSKSRSLQMGEFRAARLAGALFELVQLELCKLS